MSVPGTGSMTPKSTFLKPIGMEPASEELMRRSEKSAVQCEQLLQKAAPARCCLGHRLGLGRLAEAAAITDHAPDQRIPVAPSLLGIAPHEAAHDLGRVAECFRHHLG